MSRDSARVEYRCSFCGKPQHRVRRLVAGPGGVYICDECIDLCADIVNDEIEGVRRPNVSVRNPASLSPPRGYSHVAEAGGWVWLGGQISSDASGSVVHSGDIAAQFARALQNLATAIDAAGCAPSDVVKITYFVTDVAAYREALKPIGVSYRAVFGTHYPASSLLEVKGLFEPEAMIEIECVAIRASIGAVKEDGIHAD